MTMKVLAGHMWNPTSNLVEPNFEAIVSTVSDFVNQLDDITFY